MDDDWQDDLEEARADGDGDGGDVEGGVEELGEREWDELDDDATAASAAASVAAAARAEAAGGTGSGQQSAAPQPPPAASQAVFWSNVSSALLPMTKGTSFVHKHFRCAPPGNVPGCAGGVQGRICSGCRDG
jgi:hypothetical protein